MTKNASSAIRGSPVATLQDVAQAGPERATPPAHTTAFAAHHSSQQNTDGASS